MIPMPLIDAHSLKKLLESHGPVVVLDCGSDLADPTAGERAHAAGHLPGALHAHLERDLSGPKTGHNGRHPLPARDVLAATLGRFGIEPGVPVVTYDDQGGVYAARAWWVLRWAGHAEVAVLDGGRTAWRAAGGELVSGDAPRRKPAGPYPVSAQPAMAMVDTAQLLADPKALRLIDARAPERFRGEVEPLDPVAGHIPGALNRFFKLNLDANGCFKTPSQLKAEYLALGAGARVVHQCGSGVTACHNLLAMELAGLDAGALYPGSWSEWCSDPSRPVARGD